MEVNFKANLISKTTIKKYNPEKAIFLPKQVSFVEMLSSDKNDMKALKKTIRLFGGKKSLTRTAYYKAKENPARRTFVLTTQDDSFENIDYKNILGVTQVYKEKDNVNCIDFLETKPEFRRENNNRELKGVGRRILHSLKKLFYGETLSVNYLSSKLKFYIDNGFDFDTENDLYDRDIFWKTPSRR